MAEDPNAFQGLRSFSSFDEYREKWILPSMLNDLDTVFIGARERAEHKKRAREGGGNFILATALMTLLDHFGAFLAKWDPAPYKRGSLDQIENIARVAKLMPSTSDVYAIVANLGRNALVHAAWPQTAMEMTGAWAFGYTIGADVESEHEMLYVPWHPLGPKWREGPPVQVLKLAHNVHVLYRELVNELRTNEKFRKVDIKAFERVQDYSLIAGLPSRKGVIGKKLFGGDRVLTWGLTREQARQLRNETRRTGIWEDPELVYYRRTREVRRVPSK